MSSRDSRRTRFGVGFALLLTGALAGAIGMRLLSSGETTQTVSVAAPLPPASVDPTDATPDVRAVVDADPARGAPAARTESVSGESSVAAMPPTPLLSEAPAPAPVPVDAPVSIAPPVAAEPSTAVTETAPDSAAPAVSPRALDLLIPVSGVTYAQLSDTFTDARGQGRSHDAIDIMAATGTPVFAVDDGTVVKLFDSKPGGHTIYQFDVSGQHAFYYAHLDRYAAGLAEGQAVKRGDVIGTVGYSGNASPEAPHLHFAVFVLGPEKKWWQGTAINPYVQFQRP